MNIKNFLIPLILSFNLFTYAENYEVKMLNQGSEGYMVFEPSVLKINKGDSVTFVATDAHKLVKFEFFNHSFSKYSSKIS